jgi:HAD superfamily phosphoserine phosphatase-like hydrolase
LKAEGSPARTSAVFSDVEGTLIDGNLPRMSLEAGNKMGFFSPWQKAQFYFFGILGKVAPGKLKQGVRLAAIKRAMAGQKTSNVGRLVEAVLPEAMARVKSGSLRRLQEHQREGMPLFLLSAGLHELIERIGEELGGRGEGTKYVHKDGVYLAQLDGPACQGEGKAARALAICRELGLDPAECYAYGDTANDIPFLLLFGHPHVVDPDEGLAEEAKRRGWPVLLGRD